MKCRAVAVALVVLSGCGDDSSTGGDGGLQLTGDAALDAPLDAPLDALVCPVTLDETNPQTGVANMQSTATLTGLMICPATDKDPFPVQITQQGMSLEVLIESAPNEVAVAGSILNSQGTPIMNAAPVAGMPLVRRAYAPNLPVGPLFIETYATPPNGGVGHYMLTVRATAP